LTTDEIDVRHVLFDRLNTGGIRLNPQELRNALYPGSLNALLMALARSDPFTFTWGIPSRAPGEDENPSEELLKNALYSSLADAELVLRFFALRDAIVNSRSGSLRRILDRYMEENADIEPAPAETMKDEFLSLLTTLINVYEGEPFRLPRTARPSRPLYDALMIALSQMGVSDISSRAKAIRAATLAALNDAHHYDVLVGRGNTIDAVRQRVDLATRILSAG
jgi:hypothetical protein